MITKSKTIAGFQCPACGRVQMQELSAFALGRGKLKISCGQCLEPFGEMLLAGKNRYRLSMVCIDCFVPHTFEVKGGTFWNSPIQTFDCPATEELIFVVGERDQVENVLEETFYSEEN